MAKVSFAPRLEFQSPIRSHGTKKEKETKIGTKNFSLMVVILHRTILIVQE